ncbi:MAG: SWIM zinc finger family protein, partial [Polaromonas sp.]
NAVMERICKPGTGLFPTPKEITFNCSCPDWASMCKHVAAVLYGVGARLDQQPEVLFSLRRVEAKDLVNHAGAGRLQSRKRPATGKVLDNALLADVFGIEMAEASPPTKPVAAKVTAKKVAKSAASTTRKPPATAKTAANKKAVTSKAPVKPSASPRKSTAGKIAAGKTKAASSAATPKARTVATKRASVRAAKDKS